MLLEAYCWIYTRILQFNYHWYDFSACLQWSDMDWPLFCYYFQSIQVALYFISCSTSNSHSFTKLSLYKSFQSPVYCSQVWRPHRVKDIKSFKCVQHRATINSSYKIISPTTSFTFSFTNSQSSSSLTMVWIPRFLIYSQMLTTPSRSLQHF